MDVGKIQKINQLAQELLDHGMVESREEAVAKAEKMLSQNDMTEIEERMKPLEESPIHEETLLRKLARTVDEHTMEIDSLKKSIRELQEQIQQLRNSHVQINEKLLTKEVPQKETQTAFKKEAVEKQSHPRSGGYESDDVSIEKIFYAGKR